jgi:hypothetical protein
MSSYYWMQQLGNPHSVLHANAFPTTSCKGTNEAHQSGSKTQLRKGCYDSAQTLRRVCAILRDRSMIPFCADDAKLLEAVQILRADASEWILKYGECERAAIATCFTLDRVGLALLFYADTLSRSRQAFPRRIIIPSQLINSPYKSRRRRP